MKIWLNKITRRLRSSMICFMLIAFMAFSTKHAYAAGDSLLSFDMTLIVEFFIFIVAIYVLNRLLFKPLVNIRYRREDLTVVKMEEARKINEELDKKIEEYRNSIDNARDQAYEERGEIRKEAQQAADKIISDARQESEQQVEGYKKELATEVERIKQGMKPQIDTLANDIASRVLAREV